MAGSFTSTGSYSNLTRLELEQLRKADFFAGSKALTVGDSALPPEGVVGKGDINAEPYLTGPNVLLDDVYSITPPTTPGTYLGTLTQTSTFPSETVRWYGPTYRGDGTGTATAGSTWQDLSTNFTLFAQTGDLLLIKDRTAAGADLNQWAVATISSVTITTLSLSDIYAPSAIPTNALQVDGYNYEYLVVRPNASQLFAVPGSGPTGREQTFMAVVPGSSLHTTLAPTLNAINADRIKSLVPSQYTGDTSIDRADAVFDAPAPRASLNKLGYRVVLYPAKHVLGVPVPDLSKPITTLNPVIDPSIPAGDQRFTIDYKAGTIRFSCAPASGADLNPNGVVNPTTGRLDLFAVFWAVDQSLTAGAARNLRVTRSTQTAALSPSRVYFDPISSTWRMGSTSSGNDAYVKALSVSEDPDKTTEIGAFDNTGSTYLQRYFAWRPYNAVPRPGGINPTGRWRMLNQDASFPGIGTDTKFTTEQEIADRTQITVGDIAAPPPAQADVNPVQSFVGGTTPGARATDQAIITALLQAISGGHSTVKLKKGHYYTKSTIYIPPGVTLEGVGPGTVFESQIQVALGSLTTPVFKIGPNSRFGTYDPTNSGSYLNPTFNPKAFSNALGNTRLEGMDVVWNPVRRVWGVAWADLTTNSLFFNEIATDGTTTTFPGFGVDIKASATNFFSTLSPNSGNHTPGHYPRLAYHAYTDTYVVTWIEEYNPGAGVGPQAAIQAFNVLPFPQDVNGNILPPSITNIFTPTPYYINQAATLLLEYFDHPSIAVDSSASAPGFNIFFTCWAYDTPFVASAIFQALIPAVNSPSSTFNPTGFPSGTNVISSTDTKDDGNGGYLCTWSRREHPLIVSSTGKVVFDGAHTSHIVDPTYPNWTNVGVTPGSKYIPLGPASVDGTVASNALVVNSSVGASSGVNTISDATVNFITLGVQNGDVLVDGTDNVVTRITGVAANTLTLATTVPAGTGKTYSVFAYPGFQSAASLVRYSAILVFFLNSASLNMSGEGVVYDTTTVASQARIRPTDRPGALGLYTPGSTYLRWFGTQASAPGGGYVMTDTSGVDFTTIGLVVGDVLQVSLGGNIIFGYITSWTTTTITIDSTTASSAITAGVGGEYWITMGGVSYAIVPQSYVETTHYHPTYGYGSIQTVAGAGSSATGYVVGAQEPDFVRLSRGDSDWILTYQSFKTTGYFSGDSNVNWDGGETNTTWIDAPASKHLRLLDHSAVYRTHLSTCAVILSDVGDVYSAGTEGTTLTPDVPSFLERVTRSFETSNRSLGVRDPITLRTGYYDDGQNTTQMVRRPDPFSMSVSPINFSHRWTPAKSTSLIPAVTWSGSDWTVVSPSKRHIHSFVGNYIVNGSGVVYFGDLSFMFGDGSNTADGTYVRPTVNAGDRIYFPSNGTYGTIDSVHNEHIVQLVEVDSALLNKGNSTHTAQIEWALVREQSSIFAGIKNPGYRVAADGNVILSSSFNTFADDVVDSSELSDSPAPDYPRTPLMRRIYDDAAYNAQFTFDGVNLPGGLSYDMLEPESRYVADIGFKGVAVGEPKGCNEKVLDEPPFVALAWGENMFGFVDHVTSGHTTVVNDVRFYRQSFGPYNAGLKDMRVIGRNVPKYTDANTSYEMRILSRRWVGSRSGPPTGAMGFFATDGYRNVYGSAVASASFRHEFPQNIGFEWQQPAFIYTNAIGGDPETIHGPPAIIQNGGLQNDIAWLKSDGSSGSFANANSLVAAPKVIWDGKQFVAAWAEGGKIDPHGLGVVQEQLIVLAMLPGSEDRRSVTSESTDPSDAITTRITALRAIDNRNADPTTPNPSTSVVALDVAYSGSSYAVLWIAGLNETGWNNFNGGMMTSMVGVTIFDETGFSGGFGADASLDSPAVVVDHITGVGSGWFSFTTDPSLVAKPLPAVGDVVTLVSGGPANGSGLGRYVVIDVNNVGAGHANQVQLATRPGSITSLNPSPPSGTYTAVFYRPAKGNGGLTHILDADVSNGEAFTQPHLTWNGHSFLAAWRKAPAAAGNPTINANSLSYALIPPGGFKDPVHVKWIGSGYEDRDFIEAGGPSGNPLLDPNSDSHIGVLTELSTGSPSLSFYWAQQVLGNRQQGAAGTPPYPTKGDTLVVTKVTSNQARGAYVYPYQAGGVSNGTTTFTDSSRNFGADGVLAGDILYVVSDNILGANKGYYYVVTVAPGGDNTKLVLDRALIGATNTYLIADSTPVTAFNDVGWYQIDSVSYNSDAPTLSVANKHWFGASTIGYTTNAVNVRVYGALLTGGFNDSRSLPTNMPHASGSNMTPKVITYAQTGLAGSSYPQGQYLRNMARFYGMAYNATTDEYGILFGDFSGNLIATTISASSMEPTRETLVYQVSAGNNCRSADIAWNGRHFMVVYSAGTETTSTPYYAVLSPSLTIQETGSFGALSTLAGNTLGAVPGAQVGTLYASSNILPRIMNSQVRWNTQLNRWVSTFSVLWTYDRGQAAHDDSMAGGWQLPSTTVTAVNGNVLTLSGTADIGFLQVGLKLVIKNGSNIQSVFGIIGINPTGPNPTITLDSSFVQDAVAISITTYSAGLLWVYPREDTWSYTIGYLQPSLQIEDADGAFIENVTFDGMIDVEEKFLRLSRPTKQSGGMLVGWMASDTGASYSMSPVKASFFTRQSYNHAFLTPVGKVSMPTFTNVRSNTKIKHGVAPDVPPSTRRKG